MTTQNSWDVSAPITNGQLLIGSGSGNASSATLTAGSSVVSITNGAGSITLATVDGNGDWEKISSSTASSSATIDFTGLSSTYLCYRVLITNLQPASDGVDFWLRTSTDNGSNYDSGASDYQWCNLDKGSGSASSDVGIGAAQIEITGGSDLGNNTNELANCDILIFNPSASAYTKTIHSTLFLDSSGTRHLYDGGGYREGTTAVNAIRFLMSSGNISTGNFILYGIKA